MEDFFEDDFINNENDISKTLVKFDVNLNFSKNGKS